MFSSSQKRESFSTTLQGDFPLIGKHFLWPSIFRHPNTGKFEKCFPGSCFPRNTGNFGKYFPGSCFPRNKRTLNVFIHFFLVHKVYMLICCLMFRSFSLSTQREMWLWRSGPTMGPVDLPFSFLFQIPDLMLLPDRSGPSVWETGFSCFMAFKGATSMGLSFTVY